MIKRLWINGSSVPIEVGRHMPVNVSINEIWVRWARCYQVKFHNLTNTHANIFIAGDHTDKRLGTDISRSRRGHLFLA